MDINITHNPIRERVDNYPTIPDQLDAIFKGFKVLRDAGVKFPQDTLDWIDRLDRIKKQFPK